jgi:hypothetical protein
MLRPVLAANRWPALTPRCPLALLSSAFESQEVGLLSTFFCCVFVSRPCAVVLILIRISFVSSFSRHQAGRQQTVCFAINIPELPPFSLVHNARVLELSNALISDEHVADYLLAQDQTGGSMFNMSPAATTFFVSCKNLQLCIHCLLFLISLSLVRVIVSKVGQKRTQLLEFILCHSVLRRGTITTKRKRQNPRKNFQTDRKQRGRTFWNCCLVS